MKYLAAPLALVMAFGCASDPPPPAEPPPLASTPMTEAPVTVTSAPVSLPAAEPSAEDKKKAEEAKKLEEDWTKLRERHASEVARITPEVRAAAKALTERAYPSTRAAIKAALAGKHRAPGNVERDRDRHPVETLEFLGLKPDQSVLEYGPGEGWYTELLAPALAAKGKLAVTMGDPNGPRTERSTLYAERTKLFLERLPEAYGKVERVMVDGKAPKLGPDATFDLVLLVRGAHGMHNNKLLGAWLAEFHRVLKPNGRLGVEQHRALSDANPDESSKKGYLPEPWLIAQIEGAGFKLAGKSEVNAKRRGAGDRRDLRAPDRTCCGRHPAAHGVVPSGSRGSARARHSRQPFCPSGARRALGTDAAAR
jgi:predicted methyltransferase